MINEREKKYFLKNSNIYDEIQKSKYTYCCCVDKSYERFDVICDGYSMITPNTVLEFFEKNTDKDEIVIRVMTDEHIKDQITEKKINLQVFKMLPFKHFRLTRDDFYEVYNQTSENTAEISNCNDKIAILKEDIKENKKHIRFNKLDKEKQIPFKEIVVADKSQVEEYILKIKELSKAFTDKIKDKLQEVLRSHWSGATIESGHFDLSRGRVTDDLVRMIMMLVDQFAKSSNWSGYTYLQDMKAGAILQLYDVVLKFEELKSNNAFSYLTTAASMKFIAILNAEKTQRKMKSRMLQDMGYNPTFNEQAEFDYNNGLEEWNLSHNNSNTDADDVSDNDMENNDIEMEED